MQLGTFNLLINDSIIPNEHMKTRVIAIDLKEMGLSHRKTFLLLRKWEKGCISQIDILHIVNSVFGK